MHYRHLGRSPLKVSALCLGTMMFADQTDRDEAARIVAHTREHGVNFIDTADVYSTGRSESMVGELLRGQRHEWIVATKVGNRMSDRPNESGLSRAWMLEGIAASLPADDPRRGGLAAAAAAHRDSGLAAVTGAHYEGGHWLGSFAVYLVTGRGLPAGH